MFVPQKKYFMASENPIGLILHNQNIQVQPENLIVNFSFQVFFFAESLFILFGLQPKESKHIC